MVDRRSTRTFVDPQRVVGGNARPIGDGDLDRRTGLPCRYGCRLRPFSDPDMGHDIDALMRAADARNVHELVTHGATFSGPVDRQMVVARTGGAPRPRRRVEWVGHPR